MPKVKFKKQCAHCGRTKADYDFFQYRKGPDGEERYHDLCKQCLTRNVDNWDPDTFTWIMKDFDIPYIESEWVKTRDAACEKAGPEGLNGLSVFGKYLAKMKLKQWKDYRWADTERLAAEHKKLVEQSKELAEAQKEIHGDKVAAMEEKYKQGEITKEELENFMKTYVEAPVDTIANDTIPKYAENPIDEEALAAQMKGKKGKGGMFQVSSEPLHKDIEVEDFDSQLTQEDKLYLYNKWGDGYTTNEWVQLEKSYQDYMNSFDIQGASREQQLVAICKTYLKMNKALDLNDYEGFQKLNKMYIDLQKAAKFTEAQNKEEKDDVFDSLGEMVRLCEKEGGFIPEYDTSSPKDQIDYAIADMNNYVKNLVTNELGFGNMIEAQLKKIAQENEDQELENMKTEEEIEKEEEKELEHINNEEEFKKALYGEDDRYADDDIYEDPDPEVEGAPKFDQEAEMHIYDDELKKRGK